MAVTLYGATSALMAVEFSILWRYLLGYRELLRSDVPAELLVVRNRRYNLAE